MKKSFVLALILLILCVTICGCDASTIFPLGDKQIEDKITETFRVYVCGAVQNEGYYEVRSGCDYQSVIMLAGIIEQTVFSNNSLTVVTSETAYIVVNYKENGVIYNSINANNPLIAAQLLEDGISLEIVNKIADYVEIFGKITNKQALATALGSDYEDNFFKFFVAMEDYEEVD